MCRHGTASSILRRANCRQTSERWRPHQRLCPPRSLTVICEAGLEATLLIDLQAMCARPYGPDARGRGSRSGRDTAWGPPTNGRFEAMVTADTAVAIRAVQRERC